MPICVFEAAITDPKSKVNGIDGLVLAKSGTQNNSTACDFVMLTNAEYDQIYHTVLTANPSADAAAFDYAYAGALWAMGFTFVVGLYLFSKSAGKLRRTMQAQSRSQRSYDIKRTPEEQAWLDIAPVGREFGSPDWERLAMLDSGLVTQKE